MAYPVAVALAAAVALVAGACLSATTTGPWTPGRAGPQGSVEPAAGVSANVTWNGVGIGQAGSAGTAFAIGPGQSVDVVFNYTETAATPPVVNASLVLLYVGITLTTESIHATTVAQAGVVEMNWTFGSLIYLTEGVYEVDAELLDANGSALFHQPFYVDARAPYVLGSLILAMVVVLGIVEALWIRSVVRYRTARRGRYRPR